MSTAGSHLAQAPGALRPELLGTELIVARALRDAVAYRRTRPGSDGQIALYQIADTSAQTSRARPAAALCADDPAAQLAPFPA